MLPEDSSLVDRRLEEFEAHIIARLDLMESRLVEALRQVQVEILSAFAAPNTAQINFRELDPPEPVS